MWLQVARKTGAVVEVIPEDEAGDISLPDLEALITRGDRKPALIAITHVPTNSGTHHCSCYSHLVRCCLHLADPFPYLQLRSMRLQAEMQEGLPFCLVDAVVGVRGILKANCVSICEVSGGLCEACSLWTPCCAQGGFMTRPRSDRWRARTAFPTSWTPARARGRCRWTWPPSAATGSAPPPANTCADLGASASFMPLSTPTPNSATKSCTAAG